MKVIGNLRKIARRPSLLRLNSVSNHIKGNNGSNNGSNSGHTNTSGGSPIDDNNSENDNDGELLLSERNSSIVHTLATPFLSKQRKSNANVYGYESAEPTPSQQSPLSPRVGGGSGGRRRRASVGGGAARPKTPTTGSFQSFSTRNLTTTTTNNNKNHMGLSSEQAERIQRAKSRRRNSMNWSSDHVSSFVSSTATMNTRSIYHNHQQRINEASNSGPAAPQRRRHSLDFRHNNHHSPQQSTTPLYIIRPDPCVAVAPTPPSPTKKKAERRNSLSKHISNGSNHHQPSSDGLGTSSWHNMGRSVCTHQSKESAKSRESTRSKESAGSTFTSTGWTVTSSASSSHENSSQQRLKKKTPSILEITGGSCRLGSRLYTMGREDSAKSFDDDGSLDNATSSSEASFDV
eukprot:scaffold3701_cov149-Amphora_coffeaeformis.AAC.6